MIAERIGLRSGFRSVTHAIVALWSSELLHLVRLRQATFRAMCPAPIDGFVAWRTNAPNHAGTTSTFVLFDPVARPRSRPFGDFEAALRVDARYRAYADPVAGLRSKSQ